MMRFTGKRYLSFLVAQFLLLCLPTTCLQQLRDGTATSRRNVLSTIIAGGVAVTYQRTAHAAVSDVSGRERLLDAIARKASDEDVIGIIRSLKDPSSGRGANLPDRLEGEWELIWSYGAEGFSPLLKLPKPFRPESYQYLGAPANAEVGEGRIAQGLTGGILGNNQFWLSSGATPYDQDESVLEIQPPFRFQVGGRYGSGKPKKTLVEAGSDAEFRKVNARSQEAQMAVKNQYQQMYLEDIGRGSLRVSSVIAGDPVIVGEIFVHRKL